MSYGVCELRRVARGRCRQKNSSPAKALVSIANENSARSSDGETKDGGPARADPPSVDWLRSVAQRGGTRMSMFGITKPGS
jgi:hypothetical protein